MRVTTLQTEKVPDFSGQNCRLYVEQMHTYSFKIIWEHHIQKITDSTNKVQVRYVMI